MRLWKTIVLVLVVAVGVFGVFESGLVVQNAQEDKPGRGALKRFRTPDAITHLIRDKAKSFVRINVSPEADRSRLAEIGTIVEDYGSFVLVAVDSQQPAGLSDFDFRRIDTSINLPNAKFEPLTNPPVEAAVDSGEKGADYYVVQLAGPTKDDWLNAIEETGAEVIQYVPHQAFFVYADEQAIASISGHSRVRWVGRYLPAQKTAGATRDFVSGTESESVTLDIAVFSREGLLQSRDRVAEVTGGTVLEVNEVKQGFFHIITVEMEKQNLGRLTELKDVFRIDPYVKPEREDERAAQIVAGNYSDPSTISAPGYDPATQFGTDGTNVSVAISDDGVSIPGNGGFYITSGNTIDGPLRGATSGAGGGHGHINASIVAGSTPFGTLDPTGYNYGRGVAPGAHIINIPFLKSGNTTTDSQSVSDTVTTAGPNGVNGSIINNSWGAGTNGNAYDSRAALWDTFAFDASIGGGTDPINVVFSAGNSGTSGLTRPKMAKNVIAVGNSENLRTELSANGADNIDDMRSSSSRGPAADGRIKPDITAPGSYISGSRGGTGGSVSGHIDANHSFSIGTSHAAPQIAGVAALFTQFWKDNNTGVLPKPALVKAAILNTGQEMNGLGSTSPLPNGDEGWGRANLGLMFNTGVPMRYRNDTNALAAPGESEVINGSVADASKPVRIALVWSDPAGVSDPALVNDLDLSVTVGSNVYKGNVLSGGVSMTGGTADTVNNVEMVRLPAGITAGTSVVIRITASALNGDGIPGNADTTDQTFSLVAYNFGDPVAPSNTTRFDFDGDSKTDIGIFRPAPGEWWYLRSSDGGSYAAQFGSSTDIITPADYTGDGKADIAFFRPGSGEWFILRSEDSSFFAFPFGANGDIPVPGDFDGDGKADPAVFRPAIATWFYIRSSDQQVVTTPFGLNGDQPIVEDYDGDGMDDLAVFRPSAAEWYLNRSTAGFIGYQFGPVGDTKPAVADFTGDGKADIGFFKPTTNEWFILRSEDSSFFAFPFGTTGDIPVPGDYDGDGTADPAVFRPSNNSWFLQQTTDGFEQVQFGITNDIPVPSAYITP